MASKIKGITIEINGTTTGLQKALEDVNKKSRSLTAELREVEKGLKLDPHNTELLSQKQKLLAESIGTSKEKLKSLKDVQDQVKKQYENGDIDEGQYRAFQREIENTESNLKKLKETADKVPTSLDSVAAKCEKIGGGITSAGKTLLPASAAVAGIGAIATKTGAEFDTSMSQVEAISGATAEEMENLRDKAREMGAKTKFSAAESADAMKYMGMAGWDAQEMMDGLPGILNLAAASGEELGTTSDIVTDALTAFGLTAADSAHFADVLAMASNKSNTNVSMLGESFKYVAPLCGAMGYSAEDCSVALGLMANAGVKGSQAGTSLKTAFANLAKPTKVMVTAMSELGISLTDDQGNMKSMDDVLMNLRTSFDGLTEAEQAKYAATIFGKESMSGMLAIINATQEDYDSLSESIYNCDGTSEKMAETMQDNLAGQLTILKSQLEELAISISEILMPHIRNIVSKIQELADKFNNMSDGTKNAIVKIGLFIAALAPTLIVIGKLILSVGKAIKIFKQMKTTIAAVKLAMAALNLTMLANPVFLIVAGVAALIAIFVVLWKKCDWFREFWINLWDNIKKIVHAAATAIASFFVALWDKIKTIFMIVPNFYKMIFEEARDIVKAAFIVIPEFFSWLWDKIKTIFMIVPNFYLSIFMEARDLVKSAFEAIPEFFSNVWEKIKAIFMIVPNFFKEIFQSAYENITGIFGKIGDFFGGLWDTIKDKFCELGTKIGDSISGAVKAGINGVLNLAESAINNGIGLINGAIGLINKIPGVDIEKMSDIKIPMLAKGGTLAQGSAIVGEAGAELLSVIGGKAIVQPLTGNQKTAPALNAGATYHITNIVNVDHIANDYDVNKIDEMLARRQSQRIAALGGIK